MKLSVAVIAKNEENNIAKCLDSVREADEIIVVDTGSEDKTIEIAKKYTDKVFTDFKWNDSFADARNHAISKCTGDWILTIDCDCKLETPISTIKEEIERAEKLGAKALNVKCVNESRSNAHSLPLVYKNDPEVRWKGAAHNHLTADVFRTQSDIVISYWWSDSHQKDPNRTLRILKKEIAKNPDLGREKFYLAREYLYREDYVTALYWYQEYVPKSTFGAEEAEAYLQIAKCYWHLQKGDLARGFCMQAIGLNTNFKEAIEFMAKMSGPKNRDRWNWFAQTANNDNVLFVRGKLEKDKAYYNTSFINEPNMSRYKAIYQTIGETVGDSSVLDVGCGTGELKKYIKNYKGFDFSDEAIKLAGENTWLGDVYDEKNYEGNYDYYTLIELFEHTDDLKVITNIPAGQKVIFSVPSFEDLAHIRVFTEPIVKDRYRDYFLIRQIMRFNWDGEKWVKGGQDKADYILLIEAIKKPDRKLVYYCNEMRTFGEKMIRYMGYDRYDPQTDIYKPVFFQGLYFKEDYDIYKAHKGKKTVFWNGSDVLRLLQCSYWQKILKENPTTHLCQSAWNVDKLASVGIKARHYPIWFGDINRYPISYKQSDKPQVFMTAHNRREKAYGVDKVLKVASKVPDITFHIYGANGKNRKNVIYHGQVDEEIMNKEIREFQGALKFGTNGISQTLAKSIFMGQYPITSVQIDGINYAPTEEDLIEELELLKNYKEPNYKLREKYLKFFRYGK